MSSAVMVKVTSLRYKNVAHPRKVRENPEVSSPLLKNKPKKNKKLHSPYSWRQFVILEGPNHSSASFLPRAKQRAKCSEMKEQFIIFILQIRKIRLR